MNYNKVKGKGKKVKGWCAFFMNGDRSLFAFPFAFFLRRAVIEKSFATLVSASMVLTMPGMTAWAVRPETEAKNELPVAAYGADPGSYASPLDRSDVIEDPAFPVAPVVNRTAPVSRRFLHDETPQQYIIPNLPSMPLTVGDPKPTDKDNAPGKDAIALAAVQIGGAIPQLFAAERLSNQIGTMVGSQTPNSAAAVAASLQTSVPQGVKPQQMQSAAAASVQQQQQQTPTSATAQTLGMIQQVLGFLGGMGGRNAGKNGNGGVLPSQGSVGFMGLPGDPRESLAGNFLESKQWGGGMPLIGATGEKLSLDKATPQQIKDAIDANGGFVDMDDSSIKGQLDEYAKNLGEVSAERVKQNIDLFEQSEMSILSGKKELQEIQTDSKRMSEAVDTMQAQLKQAQVDLNAARAEQASGSLCPTCATRINDAQARITKYKNALYNTPTQVRDGSYKNGAIAALKYLNNDYKSSIETSVGEAKKWSAAARSFLTDVSNSSAYKKYLPSGFSLEKLQQNVQIEFDKNNPKPSFRDPAGNTSMSWSGAGQMLGGAVAGAGAVAAVGYIAAAALAISPPGLMLIGAGAAVGGATAAYNYFRNSAANEQARAAQAKLNAASEWAKSANGQALIAANAKFFKDAEKARHDLYSQVYADLDNGTTKNILSSLNNSIGGLENLSKNVQSVIADLRAVATGQKAIFDASGRNQMSPIAQKLLGKYQLGAAINPGQALLAYGSGIANAPINAYKSNFDTYKNLIEGKGGVNQTQQALMSQQKTWVDQAIKGDVTAQNYLNQRGIGYLQGDGSMYKSADAWETAAKSQVKGSQPISMGAHASNLTGGLSSNELYANNLYDSWQNFDAGTFAANTAHSQYLDFLDNPFHATAAIGGAAVGAAAFGLTEGMTGGLATPVWLAVGGSVAGGSILGSAGWEGYKTGTVWGAASGAGTGLASAASGFLLPSIGYKAGAAAEGAGAFASWVKGTSAFEKMAPTLTRMSEAGTATWDAIKATPFVSSVMPLAEGVGTFGGTVVRGVTGLGRVTGEIAAPFVPASLSAYGAETALSGTLNGEGVFDAMTRPSNLIWGRLESGSVEAGNYDPGQFGLSTILHDSAVTVAGGSGMLSYAVDRAAGVNKITSDVTLFGIGGKMAAKAVSPLTAMGAGSAALADVGAQLAMNLPMAKFYNQQISNFATKSFGEAILGKDGVLDMAVGVAGVHGGFTKGAMEEGRFKTQAEASQGVLRNAVSETAKLTVIGEAGRIAPTVNVPLMGSVNLAAGAGVVAPTLTQGVGQALTSTRDASAMAILKQAEASRADSKVLAPDPKSVAKATDYLSNRITIGKDGTPFLNDQPLDMSNPDYRAAAAKSLPAEQAAFTKALDKGDLTLQHLMALHEGEGAYLPEGRSLNGEKLDPNLVDDALAKRLVKEYGPDAARKLAKAKDSNVFNFNGEKNLAADGKELPVPQRNLTVDDRLQKALERAANGENSSGRGGAGPGTANDFPGLNRLTPADVRGRNLGRNSTDPTLDPLSNRMEGRHHQTIGKEVDDVRVVEPARENETLVERGSRLRQNLQDAKKATDVDAATKALKAHYKEVEALGNLTGDSALLKEAKNGLKGIDVGKKEAAYNKAVKESGAAGDSQAARKAEINRIEKLFGSGSVAKDASGDQLGKRKVERQNQKQAREEFYKNVSERVNPDNSPRELSRSQVARTVREEIGRYVDELSRGNGKVLTQVALAQRIAERIEDRGREVARQTVLGSDAIAREGGLRSYVDNAQKRFAASEKSRTFNVERARLNYEAARDSWSLRRLADAQRVVDIREAAAVAKPDQIIVPKDFARIRPGLGDKISTLFNRTFNAEQSAVEAVQALSTARVNLDNAIANGTDSEILRARDGYYDAFKRMEAFSDQPAVKEFRDQSLVAEGRVEKTVKMSDIARMSRAERESSIQKIQESLDSDFFKSQVEAGELSIKDGELEIGDNFADSVAERIKNAGALHPDVIGDVMQHMANEIGRAIDQQGLSGFKWNMVQNAQNVQRMLNGDHLEIAVSGGKTYLAFRALMTRLLTDPVNGAATYFVRSEKAAEQLLSGKYKNFVKMFGLRMVNLDALAREGRWAELVNAMEDSKVIGVGTWAELPQMFNEAAESASPATRQMLREYLVRERSRNRASIFDEAQDYIGDNLEAIRGDNGIAVHNFINDYKPLYQALKDRMSTLTEGIDYTRDGDMIYLSQGFRQEFRRIAGRDADYSYSDIRGVLKAVMEGRQAADGSFPELYKSVNIVDTGDKKGAAVPRQDTAGAQPERILHEKAFLAGKVLQFQELRQSHPEQVPTPVDLDKTSAGGKTVAASSPLELLWKLGGDKSFLSGTLADQREAIEFLTGGKIHQIGNPPRLGVSEGRAIRRFNEGAQDIGLTHVFSRDSDASFNALVQKSADTLIERLNNEQSGNKEGLGQWVGIRDVDTKAPIFRNKLIDALAGKAAAGDANALKALGLATDSPLSESALRQKITQLVDDRLVIVNDNSVLKDRVIGKAAEAAQKEGKIALVGPVAWVGIDVVGHNMRLLGLEVETQGKTMMEQLVARINRQTSDGGYFKDGEAFLFSSETGVADRLQNMATRYGDELIARGEDPILVNRFKNGESLYRENATPEEAQAALEQATHAAFRMNQTVQNSETLKMTADRVYNGRLVKSPTQDFVDYVGEKYGYESKQYKDIKKLQQDKVLDHNSDLYEEYTDGKKSEGKDILKSKFSNVVHQATKLQEMAGLLSMDKADMKKFGELFRMDELKDTLKRYDGLRADPNMSLRSANTIADLVSGVKNFEGGILSGVATTSYAPKSMALAAEAKREAVAAGAQAPSVAKLNEIRSQALHDYREYQRQGVSNIPNQVVAMAFASNRTVINNVVMSNGNGSDSVSATSDLAPQPSFRGPVGRIGQLTGDMVTGRVFSELKREFGNQIQRDARPTQAIAGAIQQVSQLYRTPSLPAPVAVDATANAYRRVANELNTPNLSPAHREQLQNLETQLGQNLDNLVHTTGPEAEQPLRKVQAQLTPSEKANPALVRRLNRLQTVARTAPRGRVERGNGYEVHRAGLGAKAPVTLLVTALTPELAARYVELEQFALASRVPLNVYAATGVDLNGLREMAREANRQASNEGYDSRQGHLVQVKSADDGDKVPATAGAIAGFLGRFQGTRLPTANVSRAAQVIQELTPLRAQIEDLRAKYQEAAKTAKDKKDIDPEIEKQFNVVAAQVKPLESELQRLLGQIQVAAPVLSQAIGLMDSSSVNHDIMQSLLDQIKKTDDLKEIEKLVTEAAAAHGLKALQLPQIRNRPNFMQPKQWYALISPIATVVVASFGLPQSLVYAAYLPSVWVMIKNVRSGKSQQQPPQGYYFKPITKLAITVGLVATGVFALHIPLTMGIFAAFAQVSAGVTIADFIGGALQYLYENTPAKALVPAPTATDGSTVVPQQPALPLQLVPETAAPSAPALMLPAVNSPSENGQLTLPYAAQAENNIESEVRPLTPGRASSSSRSQLSDNSRAKRFMLLTGLATFGAASMFVASGQPVAAVFTVVAGVVANVIRSGVGAPSRHGWKTILSNA